MGQSPLPTFYSSSDDEEEELSSEGSESESEPEKTPPPPSYSRKPQATPKSTSGESESDADSPSAKSEESDPSIKPLTSKPMDDEPLTKPRPENLMSITGKRKDAEVEIEAKESNIAKKKKAVVMETPDPESAGEKKQLFQRLWSEEDEIVLIKGMINYVEKRGKNPIADVTDFHEFVKNSLKIDVNNGQMSAKVKRLKAKYMNNVGKIKLNGKVRSLCNPHEKKMYELSEKLWGSDGNKIAVLVSCSTKKINPKPKTDQRPKNNISVPLGENNENGAVEVEKNVIKFAITDEDIMNKGLQLMTGPKKVKLEEEWKNLKVQELKHYLKKLELMKEQAELVLSAIKISDASLR